MAGPAAEARPDRPVLQAVAGGLSHQLRSPQPADKGGKLSSCAPASSRTSRRRKMDAYHIDRFGSVDGIVLGSSEDPRPGPKEILMRVGATSVNYRDLMVLKGGGR